MAKFRKDEDETRKRVVRRKFEDAAQLSITSLLDVLTIILVFLIKNMSVDAQASTVPKNMVYPPSITKEELIKNGLTVIVRMYPDKIEIGTNNIKVGSLQQLIEDTEVRKQLSSYMNAEAKRIYLRNQANKTDFKPVLLIQAHKDIICQYITTMIQIGASAYYENTTFENIYFSTLKDDTWLSQSQRIQ